MNWKLRFQFSEFYGFAVIDRDLPANRRKTPTICSYT